jgi:peptidyl-prolyl cis-trans isomerase C
MRSLRLGVALATFALLQAPPLSGAAHAQTAPAKPGAAPAKPAAPAAATPAAPSDPVVGKVNGMEIHLSDLSALAQTLPEEARNLPPAQLYPSLLDQAIDGKALVVMARKQSLDRDPAVSRSMAMASERALQSALIAREVGPTISEDAIKAKYDKDIAGKPGEEEVHARHILVATEDQAKKLIEQLKGGADFATLAKANSTDPGAAQGGDLGFFKASDMLPEFSVAAFALKPGEFTQTPVQTRYGWHIIKVEERRNSAAPSFEQVHDELRQQMISDGINKVLAQARTQVKVERFNPDGSVPKATDTATPPPPAKK